MNTCFAYSLKVYDSYFEPGVGLGLAAWVADNRHKAAMM